MERFLAKEKMKPKRALGYRRKQLEDRNVSRLFLNDKTAFTDKNCEGNVEVDNMEKEFGEISPGSSFHRQLPHP